jgi:hypothetical protein
MPELFSRMVPNWPLLADFTVAVALAAEVEDDDAEVPVFPAVVALLFGDDEPQAARAMAAMARTPSAVRGRARHFVRATACVAPRRGVVATSAWCVICDCSLV